MDGNRKMQKWREIVERREREEREKKEREVIE